MSRARPSDKKESRKTDQISTQKREIEFQNFNDYLGSQEAIRNVKKRSSTNEDAEENGLWERDLQRGLWGRSARGAKGLWPWGRHVQNQHGLGERSLRQVTGLWGRTLTNQGPTGLWGRSLQNYKLNGLWGRTVNNADGGVHGLWGRSIKGPELERVLRSLTPTNIGVWGKRSVPTGNFGMWGRSSNKDEHKAEEKRK